MEAVSEEKHSASSDLYQCKLGHKYISSLVHIVQYTHLEAGVVTIQKGIENQINEFEKAAVRILRKPISSGGTTGLRGTVSTNNISERMAKRRKRDEETSNYIDCNFILGSVAEVERVFRFAKYVLSENGRRMTPQRF